MQSFLFQEDLKKKAAIGEKTEDANEEKPKGIPEFWLTIFRSVDMLSDMLQVNHEQKPFHLKSLFYSYLFLKLFNVCFRPVTLDRRYTTSYYGCEYTYITYLFKKIMNTVSGKGHDNIQTIFSNFFKLKEILCSFSTGA